MISFYFISDNETDIKDVDYEPKGIFCQKCYLIKQVPAFSNDKGKYNDQLNWI